MDFKKLVPFYFDENSALHQCLGVVYEPGVVDLQGDYADAATIEDACRRYNESGQQLKIEHQVTAYGCKVLESFIAPGEMVIGVNKRVKAGTWLMRIALNEPVWQLVKTKQLTGLSMSGRAQAE